MKYCIHCGKGTEDDNQIICTECGQSFYSDIRSGTMPLAWFKFLIYFQLFASAVINGIMGILMVTGVIYSIIGEGYSFYYELYGASYIALGIAYGAALLGFSVYVVSVRQKLAKFRADAPSALIGMYIAGTVIGVAYTVFEAVFVLAVTSVPVSAVSVALSGAVGSVIGSVISCIVMVVCNSIYFKKRGHLFVN